LATNYRAAVTEQSVRDLTGLSATEASDSVISGVMTQAVVQLNHDACTRHRDWLVDFVSTERENLVDGSNTVFYTRFWPLGDYDDSGEIDTSDIVAYTIDDDGTRETVTVSSVNDAYLGKFTVSSAPVAGKDFYISYSSCPLSMSPADGLVKLALAKLTASVVYNRLNAGKVGSFRVGKVSVMRQSPAAEVYYNDYLKTVDSIRYKLLKHGRFAKEV